jgi:hypothetical protein
MRLSHAASVTIVATPTLSTTTSSLRTTIPSTPDYIAGFSPYRYRLGTRRESGMAWAPRHYFVVTYHVILVRTTKCKIILFYLRARR